MSISIFFQAYYKFFFAGISLFAFICAFNVCKAQQTDTTHTEVDTTRHKIYFFPLPPSIQMKTHTERSMDNVELTNRGMYDVPEETRFYHPPFKGQEYLDIAVEAYREELHNRFGGLGWLFNFIGTIAPFVNNRFEFGVYRANDLPVVGRDNPLFQSSGSNQKRH